MGAVMHLEWLMACFRPVRLTNAAITCARKDGFRSLVNRFWAFPLSISILVYLLALYLRHVEFADKALFSAFYGLTVYFQPFFEAMVFWLVLTCFGTRMAMLEVFAIYTVAIVYKPILDLLSIHGEIAGFALITHIKAEHMGLAEAWHYVFTPRDHVAESPLWSYFDGIGAYCKEFLGLVSSVIVAESVSQLTNGNRFRSYVSVGLASGLVAIPGWLFFVVQLAVIFSGSQPN